jgi:CubicO group peptidase (beta-lactamase class C family)
MTKNKLVQHLVLALVLALNCPALAQTASIKKTRPLAEAPPRSVGMSAERLERIDELCRKAVANGDVPGIAALVARRGKIAYYKSFGMADTEKQRALKRDDIFRTASQTKAVTATTVMMLWEQGKFQLDDPISKFIPEFKNPQVLKSYNEQDGTYTTEPAKSEITIRQLLSHTSGLGYGFIDGDERFRKIYGKAGITDAWTTEPVTIGENVKKLAKLPLHHNPGEKFTYGEGLDVLGYLIELVSGMPFDRFLRQHLLGPLGMADTWFYLPEEKAVRLVAVERKQDSRWVRCPATIVDPDYPIKGARTFFAGGAGLSSTALDYATFLQMYLNGGELNGTRFLSRTTVETILANQTGDLMGGKNGDAYFGLAYAVLRPTGQDKGGKGSTGTFAWGGYFNTQYFADPQEKLVGVLMKQTQGATSDNTGDLFRQLVMQAIDD